MVRKLFGLALAAASPFAALSVPVAYAQTAAAPLDQDRLTAAQAIAARILPDGSYALIMEASMGMAMDGAMQSAGNIPLRDLAQVGGIPEDELAKMGQGTLKELVAIIDPAFDERMKRSTTAMTKSMTALMTTMEPSVRDGLSRAFARRYNLAELRELEQFFQTPTGGKFALDTLRIYVDPEVMAKMQEMMPKVMEQMPAMMRAMTDATADLPKPRDWDDLDQAEKERFAKLLGQSVESIEAEQGGKQDPITS